jgi:hypothetical protein
MTEDSVSGDDSAALQEGYERKYRHGDVDIDARGKLVEMKVPRHHARWMARRGLSAIGGRARTSISG